MSLGLTDSSRTSEDVRLRLRHARRELTVATREEQSDGASERPDRNGQHPGICSGKEHRILLSGIKTEEYVTEEENQVMRTHWEYDRPL